MKKWLSWAALCIVFVFVLSVYDPVTRVQVYLERTQDGTGSAPVARATIAPIAPLAQEGQTDQVRATLYFRYGDTAYLGQQAFMLSVPRDSTLEKAIVSALIDGPDGTHTELSSPFPEGTEVLETQRQDGVVSVTLNQAFLSPPSQAPQDWANDAYWAIEVPLRRRLALHAIVLALTEDARCQSVQLLVSDTASGAEGQRVSRALFDTEEEDMSIALEPVTRDEAMVLTPRSAATLALLAWQGKDYDALYTFLTQGIREGAQPLPSQGAFVQHASQLSSSLLTFYVAGGSVSPEGQRATVVADMQYAGEDGQRVRLTGVPLSLVRVNDNWKLSYQDMLALMERK